MPVALIIQLITTFGPGAVKLISTLIAKFEANGTVTAAEWAALEADLKLTAADHMKSQLAASGIDINSPEATALLAMTK